MAFGITRDEMNKWKHEVKLGRISFLTHYWLEPRFSGIRTITKVGCADLEKLTLWCLDNGLNPANIHRREDFPHYDLIGLKQREILYKEKQWLQIERFSI